MIISKNIKGITIEIDGKTTKLEKALKDVNSEIRDTQKDLQAVEKALKLDPGNIEMIKAKQNALNDVIAETKKRLDIEKKAAEAAKKELELGNITQSEYDALQAEVVTTTAKLKDLEEQARQSASVLGSAMQAAGEKISNVGDKISGVGEKIQAVGDKVGSIGGKMTTSVTAPLIAAGTASVAAFKEVDNGLDIIVQKTGAAGEQLEEFEDIAKELVQTIPTSFETAGAAVGEVNTRFNATGEQLEKLSKKFIKFAELNATDVSNSIDSTQKIMDSYNLKISDIDALLDTLNATGQKTGIGMDKLESAMIKNSASLQQMGFNAFSAAKFLGNVEMSGADVSQVMTGLQKALKQATKEGVPLETALADIQNSMTNAKSDTEGLQVAYEVFGTKAGAAIYQACKNGSLDFKELSKSMSENIGNIDETYANTLDGTDEFTTAMNTAKVASAEFGKTIVETLAPIIKDVSSEVRKAGKWWSSLSKEEQKTKLKLVAIIAIIGPLLLLLSKIIIAIGSVVIVIGKAVKAVGNIKSAIGKVATFIKGTLVPSITGLISNIAPFITIIIAVIAAITAVIVIIKNWDAVVELAGIIWEAFTTKVSELIQSFKEFFTSVFQAIGDFFTSIWTNMTNVATGAWTSIKTAFANVGSWFKGVFQSAWDGITGIFNRLGDFFKSVWDNVVGVFKIAGLAVGDAISGAVKNAINFILSKAVSIINGFIGALNNVIGIINHIPKVDISKIDTLSVPELERGGILKKGQTGFLEGNGAEAVVPLDKNEKWITAVAREMKAALAGNAAAGAVAGDIVIPVYIGQSKIQDIIVKAAQINNYRSGGR